MRKPPPPPRHVFLTRGSFPNRQATLLADYGSHARVYVLGMIMNLPEHYFVRLSA